MLWFWQKIAEKYIIGVQNKFFQKKTLLHQFCTFIIPSAPAKFHKNLCFAIITFIWSAVLRLYDNDLKNTKFWSFFSIRVFFYRHWRFTGQQGKGEDHLLFHFSSSTRSWTFRHLFSTLHARQLSHILNRSACIY